MSIMTELFIAEPPAASRYGPGSAAEFNSVRLGGLTSLEFETLWAIIEGTRWDVRKHGLSQVAASKTQWTFQFPPKYVNVLARLGAQEIVAAATAWAKVPEIRGRPSDAERALRQLVDLAQEALKRDRGLFVWVSL